jgi:aminoglycoside phosphotransferase family enzyme/predicted kinase
VFEARVKGTSSRLLPARAVRKDRPIAREKLVAFLSDPRSYPDRPRTVRLIQTHASYVLMTSRYVYKVKKPVNLGFLDFSTLKKRRYFCHREVLLNRRLSSHVHLGVLPIFLKAGKLAFEDGEGVVEYVVQMRRLDDRYFLPRLLKRNEAGRFELNRIVAKLRKFYEAQRPTAEITRWGRIEKLRISTNENFRQTERFVGTTISRPAFETIRQYTTKFYQCNARLFKERTREQRIRDCHGDLRLEHIHLAPKRLSIYDCIEFNDRLRYIDWANDIAFLAMDLDHQGRPDLGRYFTSRMAAALRDEGLLRVVDFYKCYRAYVRGKVESFQSMGMPQDQPKKRMGMSASRYFRLALQYAVCGSEPMVLVFMGRIASGKSTLARSVGRELAWDVFSSDILRKRFAGVPLNKRVSDPARRQRLYAKNMTNRTYAALFREAVTHVGKRSSVILDATFGDRRYRDRLRNKLQAIGVRFLFVEAQAPDSVVRCRLRKRETSAGEISDARIEDFRALSDSYEPPSELPARERLTVRTGKAPLEATMIEVLKGLSARAAIRSISARSRQ